MQMQKTPPPPPPCWNKRKLCKSLLMLHCWYRCASKLFCPLNSILYPQESKMYAIPYVCGKECMPLKVKLEMISSSIDHYLPSDESCQCQNGGACVREGYGSTRCECPPGYSGVLCETGKRSGSAIWWWLSLSGSKPSKEPSLPKEWNHGFPYWLRWLRLRWIADWDRNWDLVFFIDSFFFFLFFWGGVKC